MMAGPWEKYQATPDQSPAAPSVPQTAEGPWSKHATQPNAQLANSQAKANGESAPGLLKSMISTMQGPAMGFADELAGVGGAITGTLANLTPYGDGKSFAQNYRDTRDAARAASESHMKDNPVLGHVERIAASLPVIAATPAVQAAQRTGLVSAVLPESVKAGVKYGTVAGLGESNAEDAKGMATDAVIAGGISGIAGPIISGALRGGWRTGEQCGAAGSQHANRAQYPGSSQWRSARRRQPHRSGESDGGVEDRRWHGWHSRRDRQCRCWQRRSGGWLGGCRVVGG